ncbi:MAG: 50S ribosomal protein L4 [Candidatus Omnitrophica bacterium]|nr:50S ribosomal protein L4 [Candidatus Omnitrophota bacterium]
MKKPAAKKTVKKVAVKRARKTPKTKAAVKELTLSVQDLNGKAHETITLDPIFNDGRVNTHVVYQAVVNYQAGQRTGTASTKDRGHVRGGGKKPWKQKGTGQARHGSRRSPIWRGGGVTFGPMPRDYSYSLPHQIKRQAVVEGLKDKVAGGKLVLVRELSFTEPKTQLMAEVIEKLKLEKPLFLVDQKNKNVVLASRNVPGVTLKTALEVNALDVVSHKECVITKSAYVGLIKRLKS